MAAFLAFIFRLGFLVGAGAVFEDGVAVVVDAISLVLFMLGVSVFNVVGCAGVSVLDGVVDVALEFNGLDEVVSLNGTDAVIFFGGGDGVVNGLDDLERRGRE